MRRSYNRGPTDRRALAIGFALVLAVLLGACGEDGVDTSVTLPEGSLPEQTEAPATEPPQTEAPEPEAPAEEPPAATTSETDSSVPPWVWVVLGLLLVGLIAWGAARMGSSSTATGTTGGQEPPPPPPPTQPPPPPEA